MARRQRQRCASLIEHRWSGKDDYSACPATPKESNTSYVCLPWQNVRHLRWRCHLFRRTHFRRHSDDERSLPGCHPRPLRSSLRRWRSWLGCRLDWISHRAVDVGAAMHTTKRGELLRMEQVIRFEGPEKDVREQYFTLADGTGTRWLAHRYSYLRRP